MAYTFKQKLLSPDKYKIKSPYAMNAIGICVHNTYNDASAANEVSYHNSNNNPVSYHVAIDDKEVIQCLPFERNGFHAGDGAKGEGNRKYIGIEICYSKSGGERYAAAEENAVKYIAQLLYERGWFVNCVKKHQDFSGKYCPHRILDEGRWDSFKNRIARELEDLIEEGMHMGRIIELEEEVKELNKQVAALLKVVKEAAVYQSADAASTYAQGALKWAVDVGLLKGDTNGNLNPHGALKRQDMAIMLQRYHELTNK